jgi:hypothetical protein
MHIKFDRSGPFESSLRSRSSRAPGTDPPVGACPALSVQENDHQVRYRKCGSHEEENRRDPHDMIPRPANSQIGIFSCRRATTRPHGSDFISTPLPAQSSRLGTKSPGIFAPGLLAGRMGADERSVSRDHRTGAPPKVQPDLEDVIVCLDVDRYRKGARSRDERGRLGAEVHDANPPVGAQRSCYISSSSKSVNLDSVPCVQNADSPQGCFSRRKPSKL